MARSRRGQAAVGHAEGVAAGGQGRRDRRADLIAACPRLAKRRPSGVRLIFVVPQDGSAIDPVCPVLDTARARLKLVEPKLASGSVWHEPSLKQSDGASTIHSAEVTSTFPRSVLEKVLVPGQVRYREYDRPARDGHAGGDQIAGLDVEADRPRRRRDQLIPGARGHAPRSAAVQLGPDLLERGRVHAVSPDPHPDRGVGRGVRDAGRARLAPLSQHPGEAWCRCRARRIRPSSSSDSCRRAQPGRGRRPSQGSREE